MKNEKIKKIKIEFTDRYQATGIPYPDENSCDKCEGMGVYPEKKETLNEEACKSPTGRLLIIGQKEKDGSPCKEDDYVFVQCPFCNGSRKKTKQLRDKI